MSSSEDDESYREMCDSCREWEPVEPGHRDFRAGGMITIAGADNLRIYRTLARRALKVYNRSNGKSFKLKKLYKVNFHGAGYHYMTFSAQEEGSQERPLFRAVVRKIRQCRVLFCEIKDDDEITLPSDPDRDNDRPLPKHS